MPGQAHRRAREDCRYECGDQLFEEGEKQRSEQSQQNKREGQEASPQESSIQEIRRQQEEEG